MRRSDGSWRNSENGSGTLLSLPRRLLLYWINQTPMHTSMPGPEGVLLTLTSQRVVQMVGHER